MSRSDPTDPGPDPAKLTGEELQQLAERLVDHLLGSSGAPLRKGFSAARQNPASLKSAAESLEFPQHHCATGRHLREANGDAARLGHLGLWPCGAMRRLPADADVLHTRNQARPA